MLVCHSTRLFSPKVHSADIHDQAPLALGYGQESQIGFLLPGNHPHGKPAQLPDPVAQGFAVFRVPGGAGGKQGDGLGSRRLCQAGQAANGLSRVLDAFGPDAALFIQA